MSRSLSSSLSKSIESDHEKQFNNMDTDIPRSNSFPPGRPRPGSLPDQFPYTDREGHESTHHIEIRATSHPHTALDSNPPKDTGIVQGRQRTRPAPRQKRRIKCPFNGDKCDFMKEKEGGVFKNNAELKEDALRHLNPYQCFDCGKRFGKRYGLTRHGTKKNSCQVVKDGRENNSVVYISFELSTAVYKLENAKGYHEVMAAIHECKRYCTYQDPNRKPANRNTEDTSATESHAALSSQEASDPNSPGTPVGIHLSSSQDYLNRGTAQLEYHQAPDGEADDTSVENEYKYGDQHSGDMQPKRTPQEPMGGTNFNAQSQQLYQTQYTLPYYHENPNATDFNGNYFKEESAVVHSAIDPRLFSQDSSTQQYFNPDCLWFSGFKEPFGCN